MAAVDEQTSTSGFETAIKWCDAKDHYDVLVVQEPYFFYDNLGHSSLDDIFARMKRCGPFHRIITKKPEKFLPHQVLAFYAFWNEVKKDALDSITIRHSDNVIADPSFNLLEAVKTAYDLEDSGDEAYPEMSPQLLEDTFQIITLPASEKQVVKYDLKGMQQTRLKPEIHVLFDVIHKVLLSQKGTNDKLIHDRFKIMVAVYHNLELNWARLLVLGMRFEVRKVKTSLDSEGNMELCVQRKINFCSKISLIFQSVDECVKWADAIAFNEMIKLPLDPRQFSKSLGINKNSLITSDLRIRTFLEAMARSNPKWKDPRSIAKGEPAASPQPKRRSRSSSTKSKEKLVGKQSKEKESEIEERPSKKQRVDAAVVSSTSPSQMISLPSTRTQPSIAAVGKVQQPLSEVQQAVTTEVDLDEQPGGLEHFPSPSVISSSTILPSKSMMMMMTMRNSI